MKPIIYLSSAAILWGLNFHLLGAMLTTVNFPEAGFWRYLFAIIFMLLLLFKSPVSFKNLQPHLLALFLIGFGGVFCFNILLFWGLMYTSPLNASLIISLNPILTLLLSNIIFQTRISSLQWTGALFSIVGIIYLLSQGEPGILKELSISKGDLLVLLATVFAAFYHIWVKKFGRDLSNLHFTFATNFVCFLCFALILPFTSPITPTEYSLDFWTAAIVFGTLGTTLTYILWNKGVHLAGPDKAGVFMNVVPLSTASISLLLGETIEVFHIISGSLIVSGLFISQINNRKKRFSVLKKT